MPRAYGITNASPYASAPAVGSPGDTYWNTAQKILYVSDGAAWNPTWGAYALIGTAAPTSPQVGQLWWRSDSGRLFIYYNDGTSSQWVPVNLG